MDLMKTFQHPPREYSAAAFWFWNGELEPERLQWQIDEMVDKGVYNAFMHPRAYLKTPYLEEPWWDAVTACVEHSRETGFFPWLYDEYAWPSGTAGSTFEYGYQKPSRILAMGEANMAKGLFIRQGEPEDLSSILEENPVAVYALNGEGEHLEAIRLKNGEAAPSNSRILAFYRRVYRASVDYLNKETIRAFLYTTHEEYLKRYGKDFGSLIPGIFFDEIYMIGFPLPWTDKLPDEFQARRGYDLMAGLPYLMEEGGAHGKKVRADYYRTIGELYEEAFFIQISQWCEQHNLKLTGHTEENLQGHPGRQGNYFQTVRHLQIPGADNHDYRYRFPRKITLVEPKYAVSIARAFDKPRCMSEAMGGAGWGCSLQQFKRGINTMGAMGINMFTLHGFYYECEHQGSQADWPTSFFYQNPYWKYFKQFGDYISRVCTMNSLGRPVVEVGLLYPIETMQENTVAGRPGQAGSALGDGFHRALYALLERQIDTDMVDQNGILRADISKGRIQLGQQSFRVLVCPDLLEVTPGLAEKLDTFTLYGGTVLFYRCGGSAHMDALEPEQLPDAVNAVIPPDIKILSPAGQADIYTNHRIIDGKDVYFISNSSPKPRTLTIVFRDTGSGPDCNACRLSPETGRIEKIPSERLPAGIKATLPMGADEACYIVFGEHCDHQAAKWQDKEEIAVAGRWSFLPLDKGFDSRYSIQAKETEIAIPMASFSSRIHPQAKAIRICNTAWEPGRVGRHLSLWSGNWITRRPSWHDGTYESDIYFRKWVEIPEQPIQVPICAAAINRCTIMVNGKKAAENQGWGTPFTADLSNFFHKGRNLIAVHVHNDTPLQDTNLCSVDDLPADRLISLLFQGEIGMEGGSSITVASDSSWIVSNRYCNSWDSPDTEFPYQTADAARYNSFGNGEPDGTWLSAWERGRPPMLPWGDLPLFGKMVSYPLEVCYNVTLPAGTVRLYKPEVSGKGTFYLDGFPVEWDSPCIALKQDGNMHRLEIRVTASNPEDGLKQPVKAAVQPVSIPLGDWRLYGWDWFSGRALYQNMISIRKQPGRYLLDLGQVHFSAEIWVNGQLAGTRVWEPYQLDITELLKDGSNTIAIVAANSAAVERRYMLVDEGEALGWTRYWNRDNIEREGENLVSGLLGPVRLYRQIPCENTDGKAGCPT